MLRRQSQALLIFLTPADPLLCESRFSSGWMCRELKFSCDVLGVYCSQGKSSALTLLRWSDLAVFFSREWSQYSRFVLQADMLVCLGENRKWWWVPTSRSRGGLWGLSMNLATFRLVSMRQAFLVTVEKLTSCVGISNSMCHIKWGHYAECVAGFVRAGCSTVKFISKSTFTCRAKTRKVIKNIKTSTSYQGVNTLNMQAKLYLYI